MRTRGIFRQAVSLLLAPCAALAVVTFLSAQAFTLEPVAVLPVAADLVRVSGNFAYVGAGPILTVIDIRNLTMPKVRGSVTLPEPVYGLTISDAKGYVANGLRGFAVLDLADPDAPRPIAARQTPGEALRVSLTGMRALVINRMSGLEVIDVSNPTQPASLGSYYTDGYARDVAAAGPLAFVVDSTNDLAIVDVSKSGEPSGVSTLPSTTPTAIVAVGQGGSHDAGTVYVAGGGVLRVYETAGPPVPKLLATLRISSRAQAVAVDGQVGYVAAGSDGLQILDLSKPTAPVVAGSYKTTGAARDVSVSGSFVFVAVGSSPGVLVFRRNP